MLLNQWRRIGNRTAKLSTSRPDDGRELQFTDILQVYVPREMELVKVNEFFSYFWYVKYNQAILA